MFRKYATKALDREDFVALLGKYNLQHFYENGVVVMEISKINIHEDWKIYTTRFDADIALLTFERDVPLSDYIQLICLPSPSAIHDFKAGRVVGWGLSELSQLTRAEDTPRKIQLKQPPTNEFCFLQESKLSLISSHRTFCGGGDNAGPCSGDSGFFIEVFFS